MDILYSLALLFLIALIWIGVVFFFFKKISRKQTKRDEKMLLGGLFLFFALFFVFAAGTVAFEFMESNDFCGTFCHVMNPYHNSYLYPGNNSMMSVHLDSDISCAGCHEEPGILGKVDSLYSGAKEGLLYFTNMYNPEDLNSDITSESCLKCHDNINAIAPGYVTTPIGLVKNPHNDNKKCTECHNAHYSAIGLNDNTCSICHGITYENFEVMLSNHGLRTKEDCLYCHNRNHPDDALIPFIIYPDIINTDFCSDCHGDDVERLYSADHLEESCINCHNEHGALTINYDGCYGSCHDIATSHNESTIGCSVCHDTSTIHLKPDYNVGYSFSDIVCINCHAEASIAYESSYTPESLEIYGDEGCIGCHSEHKNITVPHQVVAPNEDCSVCHLTYSQGTNIHDRLQISYLNYKVFTDEFCKDCHTEEFRRFNNQIHNAFYCIDCHEDHGIIMIDFNNCIDCHESPSDHDTTLRSCSDPTCHERLRSIHSKI